MLNDFSGLNSKWVQGTVTVQACKGEAVSTTSDTFGMQTQIVQNIQLLQLCYMTTSTCLRVCVCALKVDNFMQQLPDEIRPVADKQQEWNKKQMQQMPLHDAKLLETVEPGKEMAEFIKNRERSYCEGTVQSVRKQVSFFLHHFLMMYSRRLLHILPRALTGTLTKNLHCTKETLHFLLEEISFSNLPNILGNNFSISM